MWLLFFQFWDDLQLRNRVQGSGEILVSWRLSVCGQEMVAWKTMNSGGLCNHILLIGFCFFPTFFRETVSSTMKIWWFSKTIFSSPFHETFFLTMNWCFSHVLPLNMDHQAFRHHEKWADSTRQRWGTSKTWRNFTVFFVRSLSHYFTHWKRSIADFLAKLVGVPRNRSVSRHGRHGRPWRPWLSSGLVLNKRCGLQGFFPYTFGWSGGLPCGLPAGLPCYGFVWCFCGGRSLQKNSRWTCI